MSAPISESRTDAAALGGSVVAVAMAMFADPEPYDLLGCMVAVTLAGLVWGYIGSHERGAWQSWALATVCGVIAVPIWGFIAEAITPPSGPGLDPAALAGIAPLAREHGVQLTMDVLAGRSGVTDSATLHAWGLVSSLVYVGDLSFQWRRRRRRMRKSSIGRPRLRRIGADPFTGTRKSVRYPTPVAAAKRRGRRPKP